MDPLSVEGSRALAQQSRLQRQARRNNKGVETKRKQKLRTKNTWEHDPYADPMSVNAARNFAKKSSKPKDTKNVAARNLAKKSSKPNILQKLFGKSKNQS